MINISRRQFLHSTLLSCAGLLSLGSLKSLAGRTLASSQKISFPQHRFRVLADLHAHPMLNDWVRRSPLGVKSPRLAAIVEKVANVTSVKWKTCHQAGIDLVCAAHFSVFDELASMPTDPNPEAPANTLRMMDLMEEELAGPAAPYARLVRNHLELRELLKIRRGQKDFCVAVLHAVEGGHALGGSLEPLSVFAQRGVAYITLTHFLYKGIATSAVSFPFFPDMESRWPNQGLTEFGVEVIKEMEKLGIIADIKHCTSTAVEDVLRVTTKPIAATHSSVRTLADHPYSLFDEHIQEMARRGGIIGVFLSPFSLSNYSNPQIAKDYGTLGDVIRTIRHITKICGTHKHVGIGSDFAGYVSGPKEMADLGEIDILRKKLLVEFDNDEAVVEDIMANNAIEFILKNWRFGI